MLLVLGLDLSCHPWGVAVENRGNTRAGSVVIGQGQPLPAGAVHLGSRAIVDVGGGAFMLPSSRFLSRKLEAWRRRTSGCYH